MKSFRKLYVDIMSYPIFHNKLIVERGWTNETEEPWRKGTCIVLKPPFVARALVLGIWGEPQDEEEALRQAISSRTLDVDPSEILEW